MHVRSILGVMDMPRSVWRVRVLARNGRRLRVHPMVLARLFAMLADDRRQGAPYDDRRPGHTRLTIMLDLSESFGGEIDILESRFTIRVFGPINAYGRVRLRKIDVVKTVTNRPGTTRECRRRRDRL